MESNNNYVTREFYDANMAEFRETVREMIRAADARCDKAIAEIRAEGAQMRADFTKLLADVQGNQVRLDNMERSLDKFFRNFSIAAGVATLFLTGLQLFVTVITLLK